ncbi:hypothetical protein Val02_22770 [Virgisporangium aliadipatigenens]|uniref:Uncharacterized protein n=1 Tax=Virgisporangium aliadipatigenens TaxID=741659 RepID=A0A8J3YHW7_9ACTN|nr:hypothetical protein [Virgisporangium aliadipatigenens]GIJ45391.1 hypothetical protein Val02_22770 [Virgisporangium aliadipatigenens]
MTGLLDRDHATPADARAALAAAVHSQVAEGNLTVSRRLFAHAYDAAERDGDVDTMARAALGMGGLWVHEHRDTVASTVHLTRLRDAVARLDPASTLALRLRVRLAGEQDYHGGTHTAALAALDEARHSGDPVARAEALSLAHHCVLGPDHGALRASLADELVATSVRTGRRGDLLMGLLWRTVDLFLAGDPHAERRLVELRAQLATRDHLAVGFVVSAVEVMLAVRAGRFEEAGALAQRSAALGAEAGDIDATGWFGAQMVAVHWFEGRLGELLPMLNGLVHSPTLSAVDNSFFAALAVSAAYAGDRETAESALYRLRGRDWAELPRSSTWLLTMCGVTEAAYLLGDVDTAAQAYALLLPYAELPAMASLAIACFGSVHHMLGTAALTTGDRDRAVTHLRESVERNLALGHGPAARLSRERLTTLDKVPGARPVLVREGRRWRVTLGSREAVVAHSVGMLHLAVLLANPGSEIPASELAAGAEAFTGRGAAPPAAPRQAAQQVLDRAAVQQYRQRLARLDARLADLPDGDGRAGALRAERDWILAELGAATGLRGRTREFTDNAERARLAVGRAIRRAIGRVAEADAVIGEHLSTTVDTGARCAYRPL